MTIPHIRRSGRHIRRHEVANKISIFDIFDTPALFATIGYIFDTHAIFIACVKCIWALSEIA